MKTGIALVIPGFGRRDIRTIVSDYTGTLSWGGRLVPGVEERLRALDEYVDIHVVSSDTFGTAAEQLRGVPCVLHRLAGGDHTSQKRQYVLDNLDAPHVAAFGNGNNDALLLEFVQQAEGLAIAVDNGEGCAVAALLHADVFVTGIANALDLLTDPRRALATLRR